MKILLDTADINYVQMQVCLAGADAATIGEDVFTNLTCHPLTDWSIHKFIEDWEMVHGVGTGMHDFR